MEKYFQKKNADSELTFCNSFGVGVPRDFFIEKNVPDVKKRLKTTALTH